MRDMTLAATWLTVVTLASTALLSAPPERPEEAEALVQQALRAHDRGELPEAIRLLERALELAADDLSVRFSLGVLELEAENAAGAERRFTEVLAREPTHRDALFNLGKLLVSRGRAAEAVPLLRKAARLTPGEPEPKLELVVALVAAGELETARKELETIQPATPAALSLLAFVALRAGRYDQALTHARAALAAEPGALRHRLMVATALVHAGKSDEARPLLEALVREAPRTQANVPFTLALAAFLAGDATETRRWMEEANARAPGRFDPDGNRFDPLAFPTASDLALLRWVKAHPGLPRAREARLNDLAVTGGPGCERGPVMAALMSRAVQLQACFGAAPPRSRMVSARARATLGQITVRPHGTVAGCIQRALSDAPVALPPRARCKVEVRVFPTR